MTDETSNEIDDATALAAEELDGLKDRAKMLGITFHPNIGYASLATKIAEHTERTPESVAAEEQQVPVVAEVVSLAQRRNRIKLEQSALVRIRVACMNPNKREWPGEYFSVANKFTGTFKKFVPFGEVYHVPRMILTMMEERQCQIFVTGKPDIHGQKPREGKLIKEFAIEILPNLTAAELKALAQRQAMAGGTSE